MHLAKEYSWTPEVVSRLTFAQARAYLGGEGEGYDTGRLAEARMKFALAAAKAKAADERAKRRTKRGG